MSWFSGLSEAISTGIDKIWPDQNVKIETAADLEKVKAQVTGTVKRIVLEYEDKHKEKLLQDVEGARRNEVELAKLEPLSIRIITGLARGLMRPFNGTLVLGSYAVGRFLYPVWQGKSLVLTWHDYAILSLIVTFYYGGRTMEKKWFGKGV